MDDLEVLLRTSLFGGLSPAEVSSLLPAVRRRTLARGAFFYRLGEESVCAWVLVSGQAQDVMRSPDGGGTVLEVLLPCDVFGLPGLFASTRHRVAEAVATERCVALSVERDGLERFLDSHPAAMKAVLVRLADVVREYAEAMLLSAHDDLRGRLVRRLLDLADLHGRADGGGVRIAARVSQETLAAMIGASRAKVNRALAELSAQGLIGVDGGAITVRDVAALRRERPDWCGDDAARSISRGV